VFERVSGCDAVVVMVGHSQYRDLDLTKIKGILHLPILIDGRNLYDDIHAEIVGLKLYSLGKVRSV
jgi:UDPglucose 6-dehydrogenase